MGLAPVENTLSQPRASTADVQSPWMVAGIGVVLFHLAWRLQGDETGYWLPGIGLGIALVSWIGWRILPLLFLDLVLVRWQTPRGFPWGMIVADAVIHTGLIGAAWWVYHDLAGGSRWLDNPTSATIFLILVPGGLCASAAILHAAAVWAIHAPARFFWVLAAERWLASMVGILVVVPTLLVIVTPILMRLRLVPIETPTSFFGEKLTSVQRRGDRIELIGLTIATSILAPLLLLSRDDPTNFALWGCCLIVIVWTCIRQGLRGGCFSAGITSVVLLVLAQLLDRPDWQGTQTVLQGNLLAFCSTALLVGVSSSWIRANEARYRHVVSRIPVLLYSARLPQPLPATGTRAVTTGSELNSATPPKRDSRQTMNLGPSISKLANVLLVSPGSREILGCEPESLIGPFTRWLDQVVPEDHELLIAALAQLCLQRQPVTCEYRVRRRTQKPGSDPTIEATWNAQQPMRYRWVRDTLTPHYSEDDLIDGWEGLVEEITEQRALAQNLRKTTNMLQVLITNLPTGVFFVQAPNGYPILVNARARQLLGQREDMSAGLEHLSRIYRLHRPDGTRYPADELPISKALKLGMSCRASDIVVHRADGRKIPLIAWAAPVDLTNSGKPDAAVWVLEDLSAMQQAEIALRESEVRLRTIIETMGEGVVVHDGSGAIIECNPAACAILDTPHERLLNRPGLAPEWGALTEDGRPMPIEHHPDRRALRDGVPARGVMLGLRPQKDGPVRWLYVNSVPLPVGPGLGMSLSRARVVTTFADITLQLQSQESLRQAKEKYQNLVETLPFMLVQRDRDFSITYLNPAAMRLTGYTAEEMMSSQFFRRVILPDDLPGVLAAAERLLRGESAQVEYRFVARDQSTRYVLAFMQPNWQDGEIIGSTNLLVDITTQRRLEAELQQARHLELVGKLASGTVHDFNNLVFVMMSLAELAKMDIPPDHAARPHLDRLAEVGEQASHLAGQILAFGKQRSRTQFPVDLNIVATQTVKMLKSVMPSHIVTQMQLEPRLPVISGNDGQVKQVLMNLCLNARDSMPQGGSLTIRTDQTPPPDESTTENGLARRWVHLSITDTGHGMEENVRLRIFEPFFSTKERGTGLGMAVVQQIIHEFGGRIDVWSQPHVGTRMDIWFPAATLGVAESI